MILHLYQSTALALIAAVIAFALRYKSARSRYCLWMAASLKFVIPFAILRTLGAQFQWESAPDALRGVVVSTDDFGPHLAAAALPAPHTDPFPTLPLLWIAGAAFVLARWLLRYRQTAR